MIINVDLALGEYVDPAIPVHLVQEKLHGWLLHSPASDYGYDLTKLPECLQRFVKEDDFACTGSPPTNDEKEQLIVVIISHLMYLLLTS